MSYRFSAERRDNRNVVLFYPVIGAEKDLPICVEGIGLNDIQYHAVRENGYYRPQFLYSTEGEENLL